MQDSYFVGLTEGTLKALKSQENSILLPPSPFRIRLTGVASYGSFFTNFTTQGANSRPHVGQTSVQDLNGDGVESPYVSQ